MGMTQEELNMQKMAEKAKAEATAPVVETKEEKDGE